jgi:RHS repeat-associated protein
MEMHLTGYHNISDENFIFKGLGNGCFELVREETLSYTPNGNITNKTDAGEYAYHPTKPNAVTGVSNDNQTISLLTQDITYNAFNKAETIEENGYELAFLYGHDKQRRKTSFYENGNPMLDKYFVGLYEKEFEPQTGITRHINYIMAGDGMTAIVLQEEESGNTIEETYFTYKDHLGSIVALTNENGDVVLEQSFDVWGRYRNTDNWTYSNIDESPTWLRGYTGHEHLPHFDLINMNGRIYDPILGRMLSPDRFVPDPISTQGYNRYAYVLNNPLRYSDPSGDLPVAAIVIGATVGGYIGGSAVNNTFAFWDWDFKNPNTWIGIASGAVVGGLGGWSVGAKISTKALAPTAGKATYSPTMANLFSGTMNAFYSFDPEQGLGVHTIAHFGAGMLGAHVANTLGLLPGLIVGGSANVAAHVGSYDEDGDPIGYQVAQKFVGGALTTYSGASAYNPGYGYVSGFKNDYLFNRAWIAKGVSYAIQNQVSAFAYLDKDRYLGMKGRQFAGLGVSGFLSGVLNYGIGYAGFGDPENRSLLENIATKSFRITAGAATYWILDYSYNHDNIYGSYYEGSNNYPYMDVKIGIGSAKNIFMWLFLMD